MQDYGHYGFILIGGAIGLIGDSNGKSYVLKVLTKDLVEYNITEVKKLVKRFVKNKY